MHKGEHLNVAGQVASAQDAPQGAIRSPRCRSVIEHRKRTSTRMSRACVASFSSHLVCRETYAGSGQKLASQLDHGRAGPFLYGRRHIRKYSDRKDVGRASVWLLVEENTRGQALEFTTV